MPSLSFSARWFVCGVILVAMSLAETEIASADVAVQQASQDQFGVLFNGAPVDLGSPEEETVLADTGCPQNPTACHVRVLPSVLPPTGHCNKPTEFISSDEVTYYVINSIGGGPKPDCNITITISPVENDGGHCHGGMNRPVGTPAAGSYSGNTGADGLRFKITHTWPQVSGRILVQAVNDVASPCSQLSTQNANFFICVRGPHPETFSAGMLSLPDGPNYEQDSGPDNVTRHPDHHYGTPTTIAALQALAAEWANGGTGRPVLGYNDMSLRWGGVFDIESAESPRPPDWTPDHCGHRNGRTVDFRTNHFTPQQLANVEPYVRRFFDIGVKHVDHWHLTLRRNIPD